MTSEQTATRASLLLRLKLNGPAREIAWAEFHSMYAPIIARFARRLGVPAQETDDLVQEVMRGFFAVAPEFEYAPEKGRFRGYLRTCVCHKLGQLRRRKQHRVALDAVSPDALAEDAIWDDVWETEKLHRAMAVVRQRYSGSLDRERTFRAFEMLTLLERSVAEVAETLEMDEQSVRQAKSRVSRALREAFDKLDLLDG